MSRHFISFWVEGNPAPGGSKKTYPSKKTRVVSVVDDAKGNPSWRRAVRGIARQNMKGKLIQHGPLLLIATFYLPRPASHYVGGRRENGLRPDAPKCHVTKPDALKLMRSTEDAMSKVVWVDDSQVARQVSAKNYVDEPDVEDGIHAPGALIEIHTIGDEG